MAEITTTQAFSDGDTVTATKLNNITANAAIQTEAITNRSAETTVDQANDLLLMYDASATALKKISLSNVIKAGTASDFPISGNATIGGTLGVTGNTTLAGALGVTGAISTQAGTAASPAIRPTSDTNTGIFFPAADTIAFSEGGTESMRIDSNGRVGIGSTSPARQLTLDHASAPEIGLYTSGTERVKLSTGGTAASQFCVDTGGAERLRIDSSGNVGIGVSSPLDKLDVSGNLRVGQSQISSDSTVGVVGIYGGMSSNTSNSQLRFFGKSVSNTGQTYEIARISGSSFSGSGYSLDGGLQFSVASNNGSNVLTLTERLRIDSSGNVGIGVTNPALKFHVDSSNPSNGMVSVFRNSASSSLTGSQIQITQNGVDDWAFGQPAGVSAFAFWSGRSAGVTGVERLRIDSSGNVLIGTTSASVGAAGRGLLEVNGSTDSLIALKRGGTTGLYLYTSSAEGRVSQTENLPLTLYTNNTERLRITSGGSILAGATSAQSSERLLAQNDSATNPSFIAYSPSATFTGYVTRIFADRNTSNSTYNFLSCVRVGSAGDVFIIRDSGNAVNTNNSYGAISDIKLKENIEDASSQWNDIKSIQVRKFSFKNDEEHKRMLGLVAQEVELISPNLVETVIDRDKDGNDLGTTTKEVKYSVLYMKAVKALQEAMERIEQLEAKVAALEAA